jgi:hypothetical protein
MKENVTFRSWEWRVPRDERNNGAWQNSVYSRLVRCGCTCARRLPVSGSIAASSAHEPSFSYS